MDEIQSFSLRRIGGELPRSALLWRGDPTGLTVDGLTIEKQFRVQPGYLLLITEDSPFEESLHVYLLSPERNLLDALELSVPYAPGILDRLDEREPASLTFSFFGDDRWRLDVRDSPTTRWRFAPLAPWRYKAGWVRPRWLALRRLS